ncbi:HYR domain-containing protein [Persicobacter psychrovividus]|uniref:HYR domain-containing protein n=1 Tax=Persicobacter psychrovividus TaxID=387638 RepID=A0ABN6LFN2_9BACT|nr:hypothetical protein PEPS_41600 [Persicobacter psychrovividus]
MRQHLPKHFFSPVLFFLFTLLFFTAEFAVAQESNVHYLPPFYYDLYKNGTSGGTYQHDVNEHFAILSTNESSEVTVELCYFSNGSEVPFKTYQVSKSKPVRIKLADYKSGTDTDGAGKEIFNTDNTDETNSLRDYILRRADGTEITVNKRINEFLLLTERNLSGTVLPAGGLTFKSSNPEQKFFVNITHLASPQAGILTSKGEFAKGTKFFTGHMVSNGDNRDSRRNHFLSFMALENGTQVDVKNQHGFQFFNPATKSYDLLVDGKETYILNKGESVILSYHFADGQRTGMAVNDVNGTLLETNGKPIVVNSGSWNGGGGSGYGHDIGIDQLVPIEYVGQEYIVARGPGESTRKEIEQLIVVATEANTSLKVNGSDYVLGGGLNAAGDYVIVTNDQYKVVDGQGYMYLEANHPVYVFQTVAGARDGSGQNTPGMFLVPRLNCNGAREVSVSYAKTLGTPKMQVIARTNELELVGDGGAVQSLTGGVEVQEKPGWYLHAINAQHDSYTVRSADNISPVNVVLTIVNNDIGAGGYYSGFGEVPVIGMTPELEQYGLCAGDAELQVSAPQDGWIFNWYKDGNLLADASGVDKSSYAVQDVGSYRVTAETGCGDETFPSDPIMIYPCLELSTASIEVDEGVGEIAVKVKKLQDFDEPVFFSLRQEDITTNQRDGFQDYKIQDPPNRIDPGEREVSVIIQVTDDVFDEYDEVFKLILYEPYNATMIADELETKVTIKDNDEPPFLKINATSILLKEGQDSDYTFTVSLSDGTSSFYGSEKEITFDYQFADGSAVAGEDYVASPNSGTIAFAAGEINKQITVSIINDAIDEHQENFTLTLSNAVNAKGFEGAGIEDEITATITIEDEDPMPVVKITADPVVEGKPVVLTAQLQQGEVNTVSGKDITFDYRTEDLTAEAGLDYTKVDGLTVSIPSGKSSVTFEIETLEDELFESEEFFKVQFYNFKDVADGNAGSTTALEASIIDASGDPVIAIADQQVTEGDLVTFTANVTIPSADDYIFYVSTENLLEHTGYYDPLIKAKITIPAGEETVSFTVQTYQNYKVDGARKIKVTASSDGRQPANLKFANDDFYFTILDDDVTPLAKNDQFEFSESDVGTVYSGNVSLNDEGVSNEPQFILEETDITANEGVFSFNDDGTFTFKPEKDYYGELYFYYTLKTKVGESKARANIKITNVNDFPVASGEDLQLDEGTSVTRAFIVSGIGDGGIAYRVVSAPTKGMVTIDQANGTYTYQSTQPHYGQDSFTFEVSDVDGDKAEAKINIEIDYINHSAPQAKDDHFTTDDLSVIALDVLGNDTDADGDHLKVPASKVIFVFSDYQGKGSVVFDQTKQQVVFTPELYQHETVSFKYKFYDQPDYKGQNFVSNEGTVTIEVKADNRPPVANCVGALTVKLDASGNATLTAGEVNNASTDVDGDDLSFALSQSSFSCADIGPNEVTLTVTDAKGATDQCMVLVEVKDEQLPSIDNLPADMTVAADAGNCNAVVNWTKIIASDNCGISNLEVVPNSGSAFELGTTEVTVTATDLSGNTISESFTVTVEDKEKPTIINLPTDIVLSASSTCDAQATWTLPTASDNCSSGAELTLTSTHNSGDVFGLGVTEVVYTATDKSGNTISDSFTVTVEDNEKPVIVDLPSDIVLSASSTCDAQATWTLPTATDNCSSGAELTLTSTHDSGDVFDLGVTEVVYTATDKSGNTISESFTVTVEDNEKPVIINLPSDIVLSASSTCDATATWTLPTATDNCSSGAELTLTSTHDSGDVFDLGVTEVVYTATDNSGNTISESFTVTVEDKENPVIINLPSDIVLSASSTCDAQATWTLPTATDNCSSGDDLTLTSTHDSGDVFGLGVTEVVYTATDKSGNTISESFTVTVEDNEKPVIVDLPSDIVLSASSTCDAQATWTLPTASDNCSSGADLTLTSTHNSGDVFGLGVTEVVYTATDKSGNTISESFTVTVEDTEKPTIINLPTDIVLSASSTCDATATWTLPTASDNCSSGAELTLTSTHDSGDVFDLGVTEVIYTATDKSGNTISESFTVTVEDNENPVITDLPSDIVLSASSTCDASATWTLPTASDNCSSGDDLTLTSTHNSGDVFDLGVTEVVYTATDKSGNTISESFTVTVEDKENPVITNLPSDIVLSASSTCDATATWTLPTASDNCSSGAELTLTSTHNSGDVFGLGVTEVVYTATDKSGNTISESFTVTVEDKENPVIINLPSDIVLSTSSTCDAQATWTLPTASDNCSSGADLTLTSTHNSGDVFDLGVTEVVYTATDKSGNTISDSFTVTVEDNEKPVIVDLPSDIVLSASSSCDATATWTLPTATDNCSSGAELTLSSTHNSGDVFGLGVTEVVYTATDKSGNTISESFTVTVEDKEKPVIVDLPSDIVLSASSTCDAQATWTLPTASDNCSSGADLTLTSSHNSGDVFGLGVTEVVYTATDKSGNTISESFTVTVEDKENPVITNLPSDIVLSASSTCDASATWTLPSASDNCSSGADLTVTSTHDSGDVFGLGVTEVVYTATDNSGNTISESFTVTVEDNEKPVIVNLPSDIVLSASSTCDAQATWTLPTASDNCSSGAELTLTSTHDSGDVFGLGVTEVVYTATDNSGNTISESFTVTVEDKENPVIINLPTDIVLSASSTCDAAATWTLPTASDNCSSGAELTLTSTHNSGDVFGLGVTEVVYTATDKSGNTISDSFTVTVEDNENPVIINLPSDIVLSASSSCDAQATWTLPTASDNCSSGAELTLTSTHNSGDVFGLGVTEVVYTATDKSGNTISESFTVTVEDNEKPVIVNLPSDIVLSASSTCDATATWTLPTASDNCSSGAELTLTSTHNSGDVFGLGVTEVVYTATDNSGNTISDSFTVTVEDKENPTIVNLPSDIVVATTAGSCVAEVTWTPITGTDNCTFDRIELSHPSGSQFDVGVHTVTVTAYDIAGNTAEASFMVTVNPGDELEIVCADDISLMPDAGADFATLPVLEAPEVQAPCGKTFTLSSDAPATLPIGQHHVIWTATGEDGKSVTCRQGITVQNPADRGIIKSCPAEVTAFADDGECDAALELNTPVVNDWVLAPEITNDAPQFFPKGETIVTWSVKDQWGNVEICQQLVNVVIDPDKVLAFELSEELIANPNCVLKMPDLRDDVEVLLPCLPNTTLQQQPIAAELVQPERGKVQVTFTLLDENNQQVGQLLTSVPVNCIEKFEVPNMITPNGDGANDYLEIPTIESYNNTELQIFNRLGQQVYQQVNYSNDWDGRSQTGQPLQAGTYFYIIKLQGEKHQTGYLHIVL